MLRDVGNECFTSLMTWRTRSHLLWEWHRLHELVEGICHPEDVIKIRDKLEIFCCQGWKLSPSFSGLWVKGPISEHGGARGFCVLSSVYTWGSEPPTSAVIFCLFLSQLHCWALCFPDCSYSRFYISDFLQHFQLPLRSKACFCKLPPVVPVHQENQQNIVPGKKTRWSLKVKTNTVDTREEVRCPRGFQFTI